MTDKERPRDQARGPRGPLRALLREGEWTVDDLAARLDLTDNAVRFHLDALERVGTVKKGALRRSGAAGQPAVLYSLTSSGEEEFSRAYAPVLIAFLEELRERMTSTQLVAFLKRIGKRLASGSPANAESLSGRVAGASNLLNSLGGVTVLEKKGGNYHIVGRGRPPCWGGGGGTS